MNYFDFYDLPMSFRLDQKELKKRFYAKSKAYHPDFYVSESAEKQAEIMEMSTLNNRAYKTLKDEYARMLYILQETGVYGKEGENKLPPEFLMEMMDINEGIMELEFDPSPTAYAAALHKVEDFEQQLKTELGDVLDTWTAENTDQQALERVKDYYLKRKYLLRIKENMAKFAPA